MDWLLNAPWQTIWTACAAIVATLYTWLTLHLVRSQRDAKVIVFVKHDFNRPSILTIVIENIGRDIAREVIFKPSRPIPHMAWGIETSNWKGQNFTVGPLVHGIPALGPGDSPHMDWGQYGGLRVAIGNKPIKLSFSYRTGRCRVIRSETILEVESYRTTDASETPTVSATRSLKNIEDSMATIASDLSRIAAGNSKDTLQSLRKEVLGESDRRRAT